MTIALPVTLEGKRGLVVGVANEHSIAWGATQAYRAAGAELAVTWLNDKARQKVEPLAETVNASILLPLDVSQPGQLDAVFDEIAHKWGRLDFLLHAIAFAPSADLHGRVIDCSSEGFALAMDVSCHSFIRMARRAAPLMSSGGSLVTLSYLGSESVVEHYGLMGPVKAALESCVRYLAAELGPAGVRVNAVSPGTIATRASSGIANFDKLLAENQSLSPLRRLVTIEEVGAVCAFLASEASACVTGDVLMVDGGFHLVH